VLFIISINFGFQLLVIVGNKDATALTPCLRFRYENYWRLLLGFRFSYLTLDKLLLALGQSLSVVLANFVQILRIEPGLWEESVLVGEFPLEALQVN